MKTKNIYSLPLNKKEIKIAISSKKAHFGHLRNAIDFPLSEGTKILAAKSGKVIAVKQSSRVGGLNPKYIGNKYLNYISIQHNQDEISEYAHLKYKGAFVKKGDKVKTGQIIGLSGNTGYTSEPHLHFHVAKINNSKEGWETLEVRFNEELKIRKNIFGILFWYLLGKLK